METADQQFYIQYHNADDLENFPSEIDFNTPIKDIVLDNSSKYENWIYTRKKSVLKARGSQCFLIVGKTEEKIKNYYLWATFIIDNFKYEFEDYIDVTGIGNDLKKPVLLNNLNGFTEFKKYCGNFGLGFLNITKSSFSKTLQEYSNSNSKKNIENIIDYHEELVNINNKMISITPQKRPVEITKTLRNDSRIVLLCKKVYEYKCQFPDCESEILTKDGQNYVEVAHIKPVKSGGQSIIGNLVVLCPNHHKEFDLGNLVILKQNNKLLKGILNNKRFEIKFK